jgi:hypothetical protein
MHAIGCTENKQFFSNLAATMSPLFFSSPTFGLPLFPSFSNTSITANSNTLGLGTVGGLLLQQSSFDECRCQWVYDAATII